MNDFIPCAGGLGFVALIFAFILALRYMVYRETLALAEKGLVRPRRNGGSKGKGALIWGILITAVGLALILGLWPLGFAFGGGDYPLGFGPWMLAGLAPTFFGVALILIHVLTREEKKPPDDEGKNPSEQ
jgi:hypothetical protein